jgi:hypothetical protein
MVPLWQITASPPAFGADSIQAWQARNLHGAGSINASGLPCVAVGDKTVRLADSAGYASEDGKHGWVGGQCVHNKAASASTSSLRAKTAGKNDSGKHSRTWVAVC